MKPFTNGTLVFFPDRVELCSVDICGQQRSGKVRKLLDLLRRKRENSSFVAYSGKSLAELLEVRGGQNSVAGLVRDLRSRITEALREGARIECRDNDVILSGGPRHRLSESISVQNGDAHNQGHECRGATSADTDRDTNDPNRDDTDPGDTNDTDRAHEAGATRRVWILQKLADAHRVLVPDIAAGLQCSPATAKRDLQALKDAGQIEFVGAARTGYYRL